MPRKVALATAVALAAATLGEKLARTAKDYGFTVCGT